MAAGIQILIWFLRHKGGESQILKRPSKLEIYPWIVSVIAVGGSVNGFGERLCDDQRSAKAGGMRDIQANSGIGDGQAVRLAIINVPDFARFIKNGRCEFNLFDRL